MKITHIHHASFFIELNHCSLLFDYATGQLPKINQDLPLYIFVSHHHHDHFNIIIDSIDHPDIVYIVSNDTPHHGISVKAHQQIQVEQLNITTLESTDDGVAFIIETEGKTIYHAGDLNYWNWIGEPIEFLQDQETRFKREIDCYQNTYFDIVMSPLDPRLETTAHHGLQYLLDKWQVNCCIPMHYFNQFDTMVSLCNQNLEGYDITLIKQNESIII